jgi:hypothetical protein
MFLKIAPQYQEPSPIQNFAISVPLLLSMCGEPAISHDFHHVSLVQWTTCLLPATRVTGSNPLGGTNVKPGFSC